MEILEGRIDWMEKWANRPGLALLVRGVPEYDSLVYEQRGCLYFAEQDGYVCFYSYDQPGRGFGGWTFDIRLKDGSTKTLQGPWSSSSSSMNSVGFTPSVEVALTDEKITYQERGVFLWAAVTVALLRQYADRISVGSEYPGGRDKAVPFPPGTRFALVHKRSNAWCDELSGNQLECLPNPKAPKRGNDLPGIFEPAALFPDGTVWRKPL